MESEPHKRKFVSLVSLFQNTSDILKMKVKSDLTFFRSVLHVGYNDLYSYCNEMETCCDDPK